MPLPRSLIRRVVYPLHERLRGRSTVAHTRRMAAHDRLSREDLNALHERLLVEHLRHAAARVPYYRALGLPEIRGVDDLLRFPLLDKPAVREIGRGILAEGFEDSVFALETGGSSGQPLRFFTDPERESTQLACKQRGRAWFGLHAGHRETDFWGSPIETAKVSPLRRLANRAFGFQLLSAFQLDDERMAGFKDRLAHGRADFVYGYPTVLARYARFLKARGEHLRDLGLKLVITTAELRMERDRDVIAEIFGTSVANEYGCRDGGLIAHECPEGSLHLMHDAVHIELVDDRQEPVAPGESGEVVITNLWAKGAPLIRYRLGDRATLAVSPCSCGLPHPVMEAVSGRSTDLVVRDDGVRVHGLALIYVLREFPGVDRFRCVQDRIGQVTIDVVPGPDFDRSAVDAGIVARTRRVLGERTEVTVRLVDDIAPLPSGKHRFIVCNVPDDALVP